MKTITTIIAVLVLGLALSVPVLFYWQDKCEKSGGIAGPGFKCHIPTSSVRATTNFAFFTTGSRENKNCVTTKATTVDEDVKTGRWNFTEYASEKEVVGNHYAVFFNCEPLIK